MKTVGQDGPVGELLLRGLMIEPEDLPELAGTPCFTNRVAACLTNEVAAAAVEHTFAELGWFFWHTEEPLAVAEVDVCFVRPDEVKGRILLTNVVGSGIVLASIRYDQPRLIPLPSLRTIAPVKPRRVPPPLKRPQALCA